MNILNLHEQIFYPVYSTYRIMELEEFVDDIDTTFHFCRFFSCKIGIKMKKKKEIPNIYLQKKRLQVWSARQFTKSWKDICLYP